MTILKIILGISAMLTLIGCTTPIKLSDIPPQYISDLMYSHYNCEQIRHERARLVIVLASVLERASQVEWKARLRRISEVLGDESPTATLPGGNQASYLARLKGELIAIEKAANLKDCLDIKSVDIETELLKGINLQKAKHLKDISKFQCAYICNVGTELVLTLQFAQPHHREPLQCVLHQEDLLNFVQEILNEYYPKLPQLLTLRSQEPYLSSD